MSTAYPRTLPEVPGPGQCTTSFFKIVLLWGAGNIRRFYNTQKIKKKLSQNNKMEEFFPKEKSESYHSQGFADNRYKQYMWKLI